jgi:hypothetical protein
MNIHQEQRTKTVTRFIEGQGHLVEEIEIGVKAVAAATIAAAKVLTADDVSLELARQVCEAAGLVVVPANFLNPEQLTELGIDPGGLADPRAVDPQAVTSQGNPAATVAPPGPKKPAQKDHKLSVEEMVAKVKAADSFEDLNNLMADETRKTVLKAAEDRAEQLKEAGAA